MTKRRIFIAAVVAALALTATALALPGDMDNGFDGDGRLTATFNTNQDENGAGITTDPNGRLIVASTIDNGTSNDFGVIRVIRSSGTPDTAFDFDGAQTVSFGSNDDNAAGVVGVGGNKVVVVGSTDNGSDTDFAIARLTNTGAPDTGFSGDGQLTVDFGHGDDAATSVAVMKDGRILVGGWATNSNGDRDFAVVRVRTDGTLDPNFSGDGMATVDMSPGSDDEVRSVLPVADGIRFYLVGDGQGSSNRDVIIVRFNDSNFDNGFDSDGKLVSNPSGSDENVAGASLRSDSKVVVLTNVGTHMQMFRYTSFGLDNSWNGGTGTVSIPQQGSTSDTALATLTVDNKSYAVGYATTAGVETPLLVRVRSNGRIDAGFSGDGVVQVAYGAGGGRFAAVTFRQKDVYMAGTAFNADDDIAVAAVRHK